MGNNRLVDRGGNNGNGDDMGPAYVKLLPNTLTQIVLAGTLYSTLPPVYSHDGDGRATYACVLMWDMWGVAGDKGDIFGGASSGSPAC